MRYRISCESGAVEYAESGCLAEVIARKLYSDHGFRFGVCVIDTWSGDCVFSVEASEDDLPLMDACSGSGEGTGLECSEVHDQIGPDYFL